MPVGTGGKMMNLSTGAIGRMGTRDAEIYLSNPAVVAASAIAGRIVEPKNVMRNA
jgi:homoaconitase/3-isopropylmalate dehydratase large subunit